MFVKIGDSIKFKDCLVEFLQNRRSSENQTPPEKLPEQRTFLSLAFYNAPSLHTVNSLPKILRIFSSIGTVGLGKLAKVSPFERDGLFWVDGSAGMLLALKVGEHQNQQEASIT